MNELAFSREHKVRFQELRASGELQALRGHDERVDFGTWHLHSELTDSDKALRLKARFRSAVIGAAMAAGAPWRVNRLDWWISKLARGKPVPYIRELVERSAELCEELEANGYELGDAASGRDGVGGLYRDRYPCDWAEPYFLYDEAPRSFSDPRMEFEYWTEHVWSGFNEAISELDQGGGARKQQNGETRKEFKDRTQLRVHHFYALLKRFIWGLSYDLAVLQVNFVLDRGLRGEVAVRAYQGESTGLIERVRLFWRESSKRLGLSYKKQEKEGVELATPFREVGEDLRHLISTMPVPLPTAGTQERRSGAGRSKRASASRDDVDVSCGVAKPLSGGARRRRAARSPKREALDRELRRIAETHPKSHREVFGLLDGRADVPAAVPFGSAGGWMAGFRLNKPAAQAWLSKAWSRLDLPPFPRGPKE